MSDLAAPMPVPKPLLPFSREVNFTAGYSQKVKIRYLVEKRIDEQWVVMARLSAESDRMLELCRALGGSCCVQDIETSHYVINQEFE